MPTPKNIAIKVTFELKPRVPLTTDDDAVRTLMIKQIAEAWGVYIADTFGGPAAKTFDVPNDPDITLIIQL